MVWQVSANGEHHGVCNDHHMLFKPDTKHDKTQGATQSLFTGKNEIELLINMDVPCSNAKACCLVLAEAGVGLRKLLSPIFAAAGSGAHAEDLDTKSRCCWMLKDASTCFFNMVHPRNPGCHLEACSTLVKMGSIRKWPDSCSPWQLCNAGHDLLGSRCACYTAGPLAKKVL